MTGFARSFLHISSTSPRTLAASVSARWIRKSLAAPTDWTLVNPRRRSAFRLASPSGSETPFFRKTSTTTSTIESVAPTSGPYINGLAAGNAGDTFFRGTTDARSDGGNHVAQPAAHAADRAQVLRFVDLPVDPVRPRVPRSDRRDRGLAVVRVSPPVVPRSTSRHSRPRRHPLCRVLKTDDQVHGHGRAHHPEGRHHPPEDQPDAVQ